MKNDKKTPQYGFWKYDLFPYWLGGKVVHVTPSGLIVDIEGYGAFPVGNLILVPLSKGLEIQAKLDKLSKDRQNSLSVLNNLYEYKLNDILGELRKLE